jgi:hypothetical protein
MIETPAEQPGPFDEAEFRARIHGPAWGQPPGTPRLRPGGSPCLPRGRFDVLASRGPGAARAAEAAKAPGFAAPAALERLPEAGVPAPA